MNALRPIYYDTETTGVRPQSDRIIEIAAYDPVRDVSFHTLVQPGIPIPAEATAIHGITDAMVAQAPSFAEAGKDFAAFCDANAVLIAHNNNNFDRHFLRHEGERHGLLWPNWLMIDSLEWARKYRPDLPRHSLQFLRQVYGVAENTAHRALDDVMVLHQVFSVMIDDLSLEQVLQLLSTTDDVPPPEVMPFGKHQGKPLAEVPAHYVQWLQTQGAFDKPENSALKASFQKLGRL